MTTRYRGTGDGSWRGDWYVYRPSVGDRVEARAFGEEVHRIASARNARRTGYGAAVESDPRWPAAGFLGELAAFHPLGIGAMRASRRPGDYIGRGDLGPIEVRTTSTRQLYGFALRPDRWEPGLGGWRITAKDRGRYVVCVEDRGESLVVHGWARADEAERLAEPLGAIIAVVSPDELRLLVELAPYADRVTA